MALGVGLGAYGAHGLETRPGITGQNLETWDTAVLYHLIHAIAVLVLGVVGVMQSTISKLTLVTGFFVTGIVLFSGSLYIMVLGGPGWLGPVTPLGGICLIAGWVTLAYVALRAGN